MVNNDNNFDSEWIDNYLPINWVLLYIRKVHSVLWIWGNVCLMCVFFFLTRTISISLFSFFRFRFSVFNWLWLSAFGPNYRWTFTVVARPWFSLIRTDEQKHQYTGAFTPDKLGRTKRESLNQTNTVQVWKPPLKKNLHFQDLKKVLLWIYKVISYTPLLTFSYVSIRDCCANVMEMFGCTLSLYSSKVPALCRLFLWKTLCVGWESSEGWPSVQSG